MSTILHVSQNFEITDVGDVVVTDTKQDLEAGDWVRVLKVFARNPITNGVGPLILEVKLRAGASERVNISVPASEF